MQERPGFSLTFPPGQILMGAVESAADLPPLRFYTDPQGVGTHPIMPMLHPFLGRPEVHPANAGKFDDYYAAAPKLFAQTSRKEAEIAVFPWDWHLLVDEPSIARAARRFVSENSAAGLKTLLFSVSDPETSIFMPDTILFCTSLTGREVRPHEQAMPAWGLHEQSVSVARLSVRKFDPVPTVGFCGASYRKTFRAPNWFRRTFRPRRCQYERVYGKPPGLRAHLLDELRVMTDVRANIIERDSFSAGVWRDGQLDARAHEVTRREYVENLLGSDYALCVRGGGNFSFRLYETLQLGRIPLFVNTDCILPWPDKIAWRKLCVWIEMAEMDQLQNKLLTAHRALGPVEFENRQRQCREVWEKYLSPLGFFSTLRAWLHEHLPHQDGSPRQ